MFLLLPNNFNIWSTNRSISSLAFHLFLIIFTDFFLSPHKPNHNRFSCIPFSFSYLCFLTTFYTCYCHFSHFFKLCTYYFYLFLLSLEALSPSISTKLAFSQKMSFLFLQSEFCLQSRTNSFLDYPMWEVDTSTSLVKPNRNFDEDSRGNQILECLLPFQKSSSYIYRLIMKYSCRVVPPL